MSGEMEHRAFLYGGIEEFVSVAAPFLLEGLENDEAVVAVVREPGLGVLREVMRPYDSIDFYDSSEFYRHPVRTLNGYQQVVNAKAPRRVRALAEPVWQGFGPRETLEWARYESLINVVFGDSGAKALCPYDRATLAPEIIEHARRTHPLLHSDGATFDNGEFVDPKEFANGCDRLRRFERPRSAEYLPIDSDDLHELRAFVGERAAGHGLETETAQNLVTAVNEVAANALRHGTPPMGLWLWRDGATLLCEVGDHGFWPDASPMTGFIPPESALQNGFGLWTVRLLVDLMELRTGWDGTFVRLHVSR